MKRIVPIIITVLITGCASQPPAPKTTEVQQTTPTIWSNSNATYYDTDGDGRADRWRRGNKEYWDDNRNGMVDHMSEADTYDGPPPMVDSDYDGYFDSWLEGGELKPMDNMIPVPIFPESKGIK